MHVLWLLAARRFRRRGRAVSTITASAATAPATPRGYGYGVDDDDGPFFDLDLSCCRSAPASTAGSSSESEDSSTSSSCGAGGDADLVISLQRQRSCSASSPPYDRLSFGRCGWGGALPPQLKFCASEPSDSAAAARLSASGRRGRLRTFSFGSASAKAAFYGGRASFSRSSSSARSARIFSAYGHDSPSPDQEQETCSKKTPSADAIRRYLGKISRRLRRVAPAADIRLRKSRSASAAQTTAPAQFSSPPSRRDDTLLEKQDGIASAIAHCKESIHRASISECDSSLLRSWSDPGAEPAYPDESRSQSNQRDFSLLCML